MFSGRTTKFAIAIIQKKVVAVWNDEKVWMILFFVKKTLFYVPKCSFYWLHF